LYLYFYTWDSWKGEKKARHIALGVLLNLIGLVTLFVINGPTSFMNTPVKAEGISPQEFLAAATLWDKIANYSWMPLNLHRIVGNVTFGGFVAGMIAAYMYMGAKKDEERAYYDWMGFVGNLIGVGAMLFLPFMGYLLAYELCDYDASICPYMMADQLSMFFEMQGAMIGLMFLASNYYIWLTPHGFVPTGAKLVAELELPSDWNFLALMPAKNSAAFTLVFVTVVNYVIYNRAIRQGTIIWGKIDFASQFVLIFLAFSSIWTMGLMGAVRSLLRKYYHTYNLLPDFTAESFTPTLSYSAWWITGITVVFFVVVSFAIIVTLRPSDSKGHAPEGDPVPARAK